MKTLAGRRMSEFARYAIYYIFPDGPLASFGHGWLGWDVVAGVSRPHPEVETVALPVSQITEVPRRYGLHGTLKPPFRLAEGTDPSSLAHNVSDLAARSRPCMVDGLKLSQIGRFLALTPVGDMTGLSALASSIVADLDPFRAAPTQAELARRRKAGLTKGQEANLVRWGYPYVMEEFRFHITLSGPLSDADLRTTEQALRPHLDPLLPSPFSIDSIALVGEAHDGRFHLIQRYALTGP